MKEKADHNMLCPPFLVEVSEVKIRTANRLFCDSFRSVNSSYVASSSYVVETLDLLLWF